MRYMSDFREAMWGVVQQALSDLDFDFRGYADEHFRAAGANCFRALVPTGPGSRLGYEVWRCGKSSAAAAAACASTETAATILSVVFIAT